MIASDAEIADLLAERQILRTLHRYGETLDYGDVEGFVDCFVEHPDYRRSRDSSHATTRTELVDFVSRYAHAPEQFNKHVIVDPVIEIDGDRATVTSTYLFIRDGEAGPHIASYGRYDDVLVRCEDGRWRFSVRYAQNEAAHPGFVPPVRPA